MTILKLGVADPGSKPDDVHAYFALNHEPSMRQDQFRDEKNNLWRPFKEQSTETGRSVKDLQGRLKAFGFMPHGEVNGIFDYRCQSATRLFQEYERSVEMKPDIGTADAVIGPKTWSHLDRWAREDKQADWISGNPTAAYAKWMNLLNKVRQHYKSTPDIVSSMVKAFPRQSDTRPFEEWDLSPEHIHLIGVRRGTDEAWKTRINNDIFVLLVRGMAWTFFGSTDPNPGMSRADQPYLVPAQHIYRFSWHKISDPVKTYRAFRAASHGVLVVRDSTVRGVADVLDEADLAKGIDQHPNNTINIHWSGRHTKSWSAGCQVVSGGAYINHQDELVDCWNMAAPSYNYLPKMTRGAYNVMLDLITVFSKDIGISGDRLYYTLIEEKDLFLEPAIGASAVSDTLRRGLEILRKHDPDRFKAYADKLR